MGEMPGEFWFNLRQRCEVGKDSGVSLLRRKYATRSFVEALSPSIEICVDESSVTVAVDRIAEDVLAEVAELLPPEIHPDVPESTDQRSSKPGSQPPPAPAPVREKPKVKGGGVTKKSFPCPTCGMIFSHRGHLNVHVLTRHLKLRPFACTRCSSSFAKRSDLRRHSKAIHKTAVLDGDEEHDAARAAIERPFKCDLCDRRYATRQGFRKHRANKHEGSPPLQGNE